MMMDRMTAANLYINQRHLLTVKLWDRDQDGNGIDAEPGRI